MPEPTPEESLPRRVAAHQFGTGRIEPLGIIEDGGAHGTNPNEWSPKRRNKSALLRRDAFCGDSEIPLPSLQCLEAQLSHARGEALRRHRFSAAAEALD